MRLIEDQQDRLKAWIGATLPRPAREVGVWVALECGVDYQSRGGLIALLHSPGMEHRKPTAIACRLDPVKQAAFMPAYEALLHQLPANEALLRLPSEPVRLTA